MNDDSSVARVQWKAELIARITGQSKGSAAEQKDLVNALMFALDLAHAESLHRAAQIARKYGAEFAEDQSVAIKLAKGLEAMAEATKRLAGQNAASWSKSGDKPH